MDNSDISLTETPRDALQGLLRYIPAEMKAAYINKLLLVGFETVDVGSFVSPKAVPQMADTAQVISLLETAVSATKLMILVGNTRGGMQTVTENKVNIVGFPYSVSETFLQRNLHTTPDAAWQTILDLKGICSHAEKELRVYLTMAFGNPYGDNWNDEIVIREVEKLYAQGIRNLVLSDITGEGTPGNIERLCSELINSFPGAKFGIHLHSGPDDWQDKVKAAWRGGIRNFESAIGGFGGCPMTGYELLGNLDTLKLVEWCGKNNIACNLNERILSEASQLILGILK